MKLIAAVLAFGLAGQAMGLEAIVRSPDSAQTDTYHTIIWEQLRRPSGSRALVASITFSNLNWESKVDPRRDDRFDFTFPEIALDEASGVFYAHDPTGHKIPVASIQPALIGKEIKLLPGSKIEIHSSSGKIHVQLTADTESQETPQWIERGL
jgi:hypothetical protein